jgi:hypothetical protein
MEGAEMQRPPEVRAGSVEQSQREWRVRLLAAVVVTLLAILAVGVVAASAWAVAPGTVQWTKYVHGKGTVDDDVEGVVSDALGNGYFAGTRYLSGHGSNILVEKRTPSGKLVWAKTWDGAGRKEDWSVYAAIDRKRAQVYVGGVTQDAAGVWKMVVLAYNTAGKRLWIRTIAAPKGEQITWIDGLVLDGKGNAYVAGGARAVAGGAPTQGWVAKFTPAGKRAWLHGWAPPGRGFGSRALAVSASGEVAIGGVDYAAGTYQNAWTVRYRADGSLRWGKSVIGSGGGFDEINALAFGPSGTLYAAGVVTQSLTKADLLFVKYAANGETDWMQTRDGGGKGEDTVYQLVVDKSGDAFGAGVIHATAATTQSMALVVYSSGGVYRWSAVTSPPAGMGADTESLLLSGSQMYLGGKMGAASGSGWESKVIKYTTANPTPVWTATLTGGGTWGPAWVDSLALSGKDGLYVAGSAAMPPATPPYTWDGYEMRIRR